jgi:hypothetical protein
MFGAKTALKRKKIQQLTADMITLGNDQIKTTDQALLEKIFWPTVKDDAVISLYRIFLCISLIFPPYRSFTTAIAANCLGYGEIWCRFHRSPRKD